MPTELQQIGRDLRVAALRALGRDEEADSLPPLGEEHPEKTAPRHSGASFSRDSGVALFYRKHGLEADFDEVIQGHLRKEDWGTIKGPFGKTFVPLLLEIKETPAVETDDHAALHE